jgi:hypothetical protein
MTKKKNKHKDRSDPNNTMACRNTTMQDKRTKRNRTRTNQKKNAIKESQDS